MNQINLIGRITKDLELKYTQSSKAVCEFNIAVDRRGTEQTDFITCTVWNSQAENLKKYQGKGSLIGVTGSLQVDKYEDKDGNNRYKYYVLANNIEYLQSKSNNNATTSEVTEANEYTYQTPSDPFAEMDKKVEQDLDLPF